MSEKMELKPEAIKDHSEVIDKFVKEVFGDTEKVKETLLSKTISENPKAVAFLLGLMEQGSLLKKKGSFLSGPQLTYEWAKFLGERGQESTRGRAKGQPVLGYRPHGAPKGSEAFLMQIKEQDKEEKEVTRYEIYELGKPKGYDNEGQPTGGIGATTKLESLGFGDPEVEKAFDLNRISEQLKTAIESKLEIKK